MAEDSLSALQGLLDPETMKALQGYIAAQSPSESDKHSALTHGLLTAALGTLASRTGNPWTSLGQGGLAGMQGYNQELADIGKQRSGNTANAMQMVAMARQLQGLGQNSAYAKDLMGNGPAAPSAIQLGQSGAMPSLSPTNTNAAAMQQVQQPSTDTVRERLLNMGVPPDAIRAAAMSPNPQSAVMDLIKEYSKPITGFGNIPMMRGPNGTMRAVNVQGMNEATAAQTTASEGAKAALDMIAVPMPNGQTQMMTRADAAKMFGGQSRGVTPRYSPTLSPQDLTAAKQDFAQNGAAMPQGLGRTADPLAMKQAEANIATQAAQNTKIGDAFAQDYADAVKAEKQAPAMIQKYQYLKNMWSNVNTGAMAPTVQDVKKLAVYVAPELAKEWGKDVPYYQAAQALSNAMALELRNPAGGAGMPGSLSDADRQYLQSMISTASNDPRAIPMILDAKISLEKRNQDLGKIAREYRQKNGTLDEGLYQKFQDYADTHPLFTQQQKTAAPSASGKTVDFSSLPAR